MPFLFGFYRYRHSYFVVTCGSWFFYLVCIVDMPTSRRLTALFVLCCRHILASLHFNENMKRQKLTSEDGQEYYKVTYPKFKLGEEVIREVDVLPTYLFQK